MFDLVMRGGMVVTADAVTAEGVTDVGIRDGRISQLGGPMDCEREIDCEGLLIATWGSTRMCTSFTPNGQRPARSGSTTRISSSSAEFEPPASHRDDVQL
jgi:dihydroorotase-like cyclic amidohydrolase